MEIIRLLNNKEYTLIVNGVSESENKVIFRILKTEPIENVILEFEDFQNISAILLLDNSGELLRSPYKGYTVMKSVKLERNIVIDQENTGTEEEPEYIDIKNDIYEITLAKPGLEDQVALNTANIDYLAMESGVDI